MIYIKVKNIKKKTKSSSFYFNISFKAFNTPSSLFDLVIYLALSFTFSLAFSIAMPSPAYLSISISLLPSPKAMTFSFLIFNLSHIYFNAFPFDALFETNSKYVGCDVK